MLLVTVSRAGLRDQWLRSAYSLYSRNRIIVYIYIFFFRGLWNVPYVSSCYLINATVLQNSKLAPSYRHPNLDFDMAFCNDMRSKVCCLFWDMQGCPVKWCWSFSLYSQGKKLCTWRHIRELRCCRWASQSVGVIPWYLYCLIWDIDGVSRKLVLNP